MNRVTLFLTHGGVLVLGFVLGTYWDSSRKPNLLPDERAPIQSALDPKSPATAEVSPGVPKKESANPRAERTSVQVRNEFEQMIAQNDLGGASELLRELEKMDPQGASFLESRAQFFVRQRKWEEALPAVEACLNLFPRSKSCLTDRAGMTLEQGTRVEQSQAVNACLKYYPKDPQCRIIWGLVLMNQGKFSEAVKLYQELIDSNGDYGVRFTEEMLFWQMGLALEGAKRMSEALTFFERACHLGSQESCRKQDELRTKQ